MRIEPTAGCMVERQFGGEFRGVCRGIEPLPLDDFKSEFLPLPGLKGIEIHLSRFSKLPTDESGQGSRLRLFDRLMRTRRFHRYGSIDHGETESIRNAAMRDKPQRMNSHAGRRVDLKVEQRSKHRYGFDLLLGWSHSWLDQVFDLFDAEDSTRNSTVVAPHSIDAVEPVASDLDLQEIARLPC